MSRGEPQRLATWILTRCASEELRESFVGDLMEQYEERGGWWYWRQALYAIRAHSVRVLLTATESQVPAAEYVGDLVMWIALGMCGLVQLLIFALLCLSWTPLIPSDLSITVVSTMIAAAFIGAVKTVHKLRLRASAAT